MNIPAAELILFYILAVSVASDLKTRRIPNTITAPAIAAAFIIHFIANGPEGLWTSLTGMLAGAALMWLPFMFRALGGGDLKLMAAIGALKGAPFTLDTFLCAAVAGGAIALVLAVSRGRLGYSLKNIKYIFVSFALKSKVSECAKKEMAAGAFPYAAAIAIGVIASEILSPWLFSNAG